MPKEGIRVFRSFEKGQTLTMKTVSRFRRTKHTRSGTRIFEATIDKFYQDPRSSLTAKTTGIGAVHLALTADLRKQFRISGSFQLPDFRAAIVGTSVGYAMAGGRVMSELMYLDLSAARVTKCSTRCPNGRQ